MAADRLARLTLAVTWDAEGRPTMTYHGSGDVGGERTSTYGILTDSLIADLLRNVELAGMAGSLA